jgi:hypothetical protein
MDETALYWKTVPDRTLSTVQRAGGKVNKARITANFYCNASRTDKLPIWFIGTAAKPRCFAATDTDITNLPMVWRSKKKGWMNAQLFWEWLYWFDAHMEGR